MCGIVYSHSFSGKPVNNVIINQYRRQISRGTEGFGVFDGKRVFKAAQEKRIFNWLGKKKNQKDMILFHHRWPTSTDNRRKAAHPFHTGNHFGDTKYVLVHNGSIDNAKELYKEHLELGIKYSSVLEDGKFNDSEALLWDFALKMEKGEDALDAYGGIAFVAVKMVKEELKELYFARNWYKPLNMFMDDEGLMLSSTGQGEEIEQNTLYTYQYKTKKIDEKKFKVNSYDAKSWNSSSSTYDTKSQTWKKDTTNNSALGYLNYRGEFVLYENEYDDMYEEYMMNGYSKTAPTLELPNESACSVNQIASETEIQHKTFIEACEGQSEYSMRFNLYETYMRQADGVYEDAYWAMEADYCLFEEDAFSIHKQRLLALIQGAMNILFTQTEYSEDVTVNMKYSSKERILLNVESI